MDNSYIVYRHTSPHGKVYIGITKQHPAKRWKKGLGYKNNPRFFNAINKYGWENFTHEILYESLSKEDAEKAEIRLIAEHDSTNPSKGYNIAIGGETTSPTETTKEKTSASVSAVWERDGYREATSEKMRGIKRTETARANISAAQRKRFSNPAERQKISDRQKGKTRSEEAKAKTSASLKAFYADASNRERHKAKQKEINRDAHKRGVVCVDTGEHFEAICDAADKYNISHQNIISVCRGKRKSAGGHRWEYSN